MIRTLHIRLGAVTRALLRRLGIRFESDRIEAEVNAYARDLIERGAIEAADWQYISAKIAAAPIDTDTRAMRVLAATLVLGSCARRHEANQELN